MNKIIYECYRYVPSCSIEKVTDVQIKKYIFEKKHFLKILYNALVSGLKHKVYFISDDKGIVHFSMVIGKCRKFAFLDKNDHVIGPCWTRDDCRGKSVYSNVINHIGSLYYDKNTTGQIYILVQKKNIASIKGVEKGSFIKIGTVEKSKYLKWFSKNINYFE